MEDFVPFELAKKLEGLGFDESSLFFYREDDEDKCVHCVDTNQPLIDAKIIIAPTISQVLKWLRDDKAIYLDIVLWKKGWYCDVWVFEYYEEEKEYAYKIEYQSNDYNSYEQAALAGIKYVLDNLI